MRIFAQLRLPDGSTAELSPGDVVGRLATAALRLDDPRVSEAHALVSLRGSDLKLLALRGILAVDRKQRTEVTLDPGVKVALARDLVLEVIEVCIPAKVLTVSLPGLPAQPLFGAVFSVVREPTPGLPRGLPTRRSGPPLEHRRGLG